MLRRSSDGRPQRPRHGHSPELHGHENHPEQHPQGRRAPTWPGAASGAEPAQTPSGPAPCTNARPLGLALRTSSPGSCWFKRGGAPPDRAGGWGHPGGCWGLPEVLGGHSSPRTAPPRAGAWGTGSSQENRIRPRGAAAAQPPPPDFPDSSGCAPQYHKQNARPQCKQNQFAA